LIESPSEAEAQCAQLCKEGLVYATATEDMDGLTFGSPRLVRNLTTGNNEKVKEYSLEKVLDGLGLTQHQFIDLGILMGCDYCDSIRGIGGKKGLDLISQFGSIEQILEQKFGITEFVDVDVDYGDRKEVVEVIKDEDNSQEKNGEEDKPLDESVNESQEVEDAKIDVSQEVSDSEQTQREEEPQETDSQKVVEKKEKKKKKGTQVPENWLFIGARKLFIEPNVLKGSITEADLKQKDFDEEGIVQFLCAENGFSEDRVRNGLKRVKDSKTKTSQTRIDTFFKTMPTVKSEVKNDKSKDKNDKKSTKRSTPQSKGGSNKRGRR